jgi:GTP cyclohydrolase II
MCRRIRCEQCQKPTYAGCGKHVEQVLRDIAQVDRCHCRELATKSAAPANANAHAAHGGSGRVVYGAS